MGMRLLVVVGALIVLGVGGILWMRMTSWGTSAKSTFDSATAQFAVCPNSPNCVSTQMPTSDSEHAIAAIPFTGTADEAKAKLMSVITAMQNVTMISDEDRYIYSEFRTPMMRFVDDVEFYIDDASKTIQFRSASRVGQGDGGANRKRMEEIRRLFAGTK